MDGSSIDDIEFVWYDIATILSKVEFSISKN